MNASMRKMIGPVAAMALALVACKGMGGGEETTEAKPEETKKKEKKDDEGETKSAKSDADEEKAGGDLAEAPEPAPEIVPGKEATPFVGKKSKAPTTAEWDAQTKEVTVHGSSARMCETKMVREWLRVSCRGEPEGYGKAQGVKVLSGGGRGDDFVFNGPGVASLIVRFVPGVDLKAQFQWERKSSELHVYWPAGAPETAYKGKFR
jgi:hypothetical protein